MADARTLPVLSESKRLRFFSLTAFYFAQGVPIGLLNVALPAWLAEQGHSPAEIGTFVAAIGLPWAFKLVAGPFMDRYQFPAMGIRRPWVMGAQAGLMLALATLGLAPGGEGQFYALLAIGTLANSFAATQDVAVDGLAINVLPHREQGRANALMMFGQVVGTGVFGGLSGVLLAHAGLPTTALVAAAAVLVVFLVSLLARERPGERLLPWTAGEAHQPLAPPAGSLFSIFGNLLTALCLPMSLLLMLATVLARVSTGMTLVIYPVFAVNELGYDAEAYSQVVSVIYTTAAFAGLAVGPLVDRAGPKRVLTVSLVFIAMVFGAFSVTPALWGSGAYVLVMVMLAEVGIQAFTIAVIAQHMNITWIKVAATQFAIYMAVANLGRSGGAAAFSVLSGILELHQIFMVMAALSLLAAVALVPFHQSRHHKRLRLLAESVP